MGWFGFMCVGVVWVLFDCMVCDVTTSFVFAVDPVVAKQRLSGWTEIDDADERLS